MPLSGLGVRLAGANKPEAYLPPPHRVYTRTIDVSHKKNGPTFKQGRFY